MCLAPMVNTVKQKLLYTLTVRRPPDFTLLFYLRCIFGLHTRREREREREREIVSPPLSPSQALAKLRSCCPHCPDRVSQASSFFFLIPQLFFSLLLNVVDLAATNHQPTSLHPQTHLIWPSLSSIHFNLSLSRYISLSLNLSLFLSPLIEYIMYML